MQREKDFLAYLETGWKESTAQKYSRAIITISNELISYGLIDRSIYSIDDKQFLGKLVELYLSVPDLERKDQRGKRMYSNALKRYYEYFIEKY